MPEINRSALLPYPAQALYDIVNDVAAYPQFLPWCGNVEIEQADAESMRAAVQMRGAGLNQWFKTQNRMQPGRSIKMQLLEGPFERLQGHWQFTAIDAGCKIELRLDFEFKGGFASAIIAPAFTRIANTMVDSFCERARELHER